MMAAEPMERTVLSCTNCGREIECCEFCDETDCGAELCYRCVNVALGQAMPQPHQDGG
jgi:hypothetical protein